MQTAKIISFLLGNIIFFWIADKSSESHNTLDIKRFRCSNNIIIIILDHVLQDCRDLINWFILQDNLFHDWRWCSTDGSLDCLEIMDITHPEAIVPELLSLHPFFLYHFGNDLSTGCIRR